MAVGQYIDGAERDGVETRIDVRIEEGVLILDVAPARKKRRTEIKFPLMDLATILGQNGSTLRTGALPVVPTDDLDPADAVQIGGVPDLEDDFAPPAA